MTTGSPAATRAASSSLVAGIVAAYLIVLPFYISYVFTHVARGFVPAPALGTAYEDVTFTTSDGLELKGWYVPSKNRAAVISFPGREGRSGRRGCSRGTATACSSSTDAARARARATPTRFGWAGERDLHAAVAFLRTRPDVDPDRIGGIGLSVGGEMMIEAAAESDGLKAIVSEGAGIRSIREARASRGDTQAARGRDRARAGDTGRRALRERPAAAEPAGSRRPHRAPSRLPDLRGARPGRRGGAHRDVLRRRAGAHDHLARPRRRAHRRDRGPPGRVRAARDPVLRPTPSCNDEHGVHAAPACGEPSSSASRSSTSSSGCSTRRKIPRSATRQACSSGSTSRSSSSSAGSRPCSGCSSRDSTAALRPSRACSSSPS